LLQLAALVADINVVATKVAANKMLWNQQNTEGSHDFFMLNFFNSK
jgi:hypothetical protein